MSEAIDIAECIVDEKMLIDAISGILVFSDKVISDDDAERIKRRLRMTKIERLYEEEKEQAVRTAAKKEKKNIASNLLRDGITIEKVIQFTGLSRRTVQGLAAKI
ncbi:MAG: hypothetical protein IJT96_01535 [Lachnospiraceae bacterium]|nr:hypothetical protein [Lachnospiraceae bacterium]